MTAFRSRSRRAGCLVASFAALVVTALLGSSGTASAARRAAGDPVRTAVTAVDAMSSGSAEFGVAVLDRTTGVLTLGREGATPFFSASVVKLFTVVDILHRTETGAAKLTPAQLVSLKRTLTVSDDAAMSALWNAFGGPSTITELIGLAGLKDTRPPARPGDWGATRLSPRDVVAVYRYLLTSIAAHNRDIVITALASAPDTGADGTSQAFGLLHRPRAPGVAAKQGWMRDGANLHLHSTGMVGANHRYLIAVLTKQPVSLGYAAGQARVTTATQLLTSALGVAA
ncbi:serine hydrolase [Pseudonocardia spinosispora]|uniref:serine hydrolase n=1 Tax=Pseudonocardia spinosispora TaxID=103441 RepID=UPI00041260F1|nr:serine hydrolase [Pseudonocardia spinosispora]